MKNLLLILLLFFITLTGISQVSYQHISDTEIYQFLDELANDDIIEINSVVKPYSRVFIANSLKTALNSEHINVRQKKEVEMYLREYGFEIGLETASFKSLFKKNNLDISLLPPVVKYHDSSLTIMARPIYGIRYFTNKNNSFYHSYGGAEFTASINKHWGAYASLRDNYQQKEILASPTYFTQEQGGNYKVGCQGREGGDFSEMRGGITYSWAWGHVGLIKDHIQWGDNYNGSNILSGRNPSFAMIKLQLKPLSWLQFDYFHGWLVSEVIDSTRSYYTSNNDFRARYREKYIAANMYTVTPFKKLDISFGNSIVYSDMDFQPAYLIPFFFFKSLDHTLNHKIENQNSQMFFNISSRNIKHLHLFTSVYCDEFSVTRLSDSDKHNFMSYKGGVGLSNWPIKNTGVNIEYTITSPITYKHRVPSTTFATNEFNLGHYLKDNSEDLYLAMWYKPISTIILSASYNYARHGSDYAYVFDGDIDIDEKPFLENTSWDSRRALLKLTYHPQASFSVFAEYEYSVIKGYELDNKTADYYLNLFTPDYLHGTNNTFIVGFRFGI